MLERVGRLNDGTMFPPKYIENKLKFFPDIREAVAYGDKRDFVTVIVQDAVYASTKGELYCLELSTGSIRWHNNLKGLGLGLISIGNDPTASAEFRRQAAAASGG